MSGRLAEGKDAGPRILASSEATKLSETRDEERREGAPGGAASLYPGGSGRHAAESPVMPKAAAKTLHFTDRNAWRAWLEENHATEAGIWLVFDKAHTGKPRLLQPEAVEEALCFGWIDSIIRRLDDETYSQMFTPRTDTAKWSALNISRVQRLVREGLMTPAGLVKIDPALLEREPVPRPRTTAEITVPDFVAEGLRRSVAAWDNFNRLAPSYRRQYIGWISDAKREETRAKRIAEAIRRLERNEKLGMV